MSHTLSLAKIVLVVPIALAMLGLVLGLTLGLLMPEFASAISLNCFQLGGKAMSAIWRNYWAFWYLTVPVTGFVLWLDYEESKSF